MMILELTQFLGDPPKAGHYFLPGWALAKGYFISPASPPPFNGARITMHK